MLRPVPTKKSPICLPLPSGPRRRHNSISRFTWLLPGPSLLWSHVFVLYVQFHRWQRPSGWHPPILPRGVSGRLPCVMVRVSRCASPVPPSESWELCLPIPCRPPWCPCSFAVQLWLGRAGALGRCRTLGRNCCGQWPCGACGPLFRRLLALCYFVPVNNVLGGSGCARLSDVAFLSAAGGGQRAGGCVAGWALGVSPYRRHVWPRPEKRGGALRLDFGDLFAPWCNALVRLRGVLGVISRWPSQPSVQECTGVSSFASQWQ